MAAGQKSRSLKSTPTPFVVAAIVGVLVLLLAWMAKVNFAPALREPPVGPPTAQSTWVEQKAKETGGDINNLSAEDRQKLEQMTMGHGEFALRQAYRKLKK